MTATSRTARASLVVSFVVYLVMLAWIVLWKLEVPWVGEDAHRVVKLVPFVPGAGTGASRPLEVVANVLLFVPFGVYLGLIAPSWSWWRATGVMASASLGLELAQYVLAVGSTDVTDLIVNTAGGLAGMGLVAVARRRLATRTAAVMARWCSIATVLGLLASALVVAAPLDYAPPDARTGIHRSVPGSADE